MRTIAYFAELWLCILLCSCLQLQFELLAFSTTMSDPVYYFHLGKCSQLQWEDSTLSLKSILKCISFLFLNLSCILHFSALKKEFLGLCGYSINLWLDVLIHCDVELEAKETKIGKIQLSCIMKHLTAKELETLESSSFLTILAEDPEWVLGSVHYKQTFSIISIKTNIKLLL